QLGISAMERINYILEESAPVREVKFPPGKDVESIEIKNLSFNYPGSEKKVLSDINMVIKKGEMIGIAGEVGSGKSTFLDLLSGLLTPDPGMIFVNGIDTSEMEKRNLHSLFSVVSQDPFLFSGTITENISIGMEKADDEKVRESVSIASLDTDVNSFPYKYEQRVGERGITLSGGQKQRMAIARALSNPSPVLLFDDPLSSVDSKTETKILSNLKKIRSADSENVFRTVLIISHRISALKECDKIYMFKNGRILESGDHSELIKKKGKYYLVSVMQQMEEK
ncbi:MAG: ABC transporter ATP-binding protein, partial [Candidatus Aminicenantes bacterium]|nr:ABC transporter ATP-binding protein [Candidatus Aminicenantes bacterium]